MRLKFCTLGVLLYEIWGYHISNLDVVVLKVILGVIRYTYDFSENMIFKTLMLQFLVLSISTKLTVI